MINSGKLYGSARRAVSPRVYLTREEKQRRIREHLQLLDQNELPAMVHRFEGALPHGGQPILNYLDTVRGLLRNVAWGGDVAPDTLTQAFDKFETACEEQGLSPSRPDTIAGSLTRRLRNEVMSVADYLRST